MNPAPASSPYQIVPPHPLVTHSTPPINFVDHPINRLPMEILSTIFGMTFQKLNDWKNFRKGCRGMQNVAHTEEAARVLGRISLGQLPTEKAIAFFPKFFTQLPPRLFLDLSRCPNKSSPPVASSSPFVGLTALTTLQSLNVSWNMALTNADVARIAGMTTLQELNISNTKTTTLPPLPALTSLNLQNCSNLNGNALSRIKECTSLVSLNLALCPKLKVEDIKDLTALKKLVSLQLDGIPFAEDVLPALSSFLTNLEQLGCNGCSFTGAGLANFNMPSLKALDLSYMNNLNPAFLNHLSRLTGLTALNLNSTKGNITIVHLNFVPCLTNLRQLQLQGADFHGGLSILRPLTNLTSLNLENEVGLNLDRLTEISHLTSLQEIILKRSLVGEQGLLPLTPFVALRKLDLSEIPNLEDHHLPELTTLTRLEDIDLSNNHHLTDQAFLVFEHWTSLESLKINSMLIQGDGMSYLPSSLQALDLQRNTALTVFAMPHFQAMTHLRELNVAACPKLLISEEVFNRLKRALPNTQIKPEKYIRQNVH